ncbi:hypothetical protein [Chitinivorax sp. B]|uniref:hypothetical protein n=1 Tax=Chitinivorax sp. B TaxID=2502235 RepID=UPI0010F62B6E|nr:hypothetical protein [Chitinivorax sp. B]
MNYIKERLGSPSTWAGLAILADAVARWIAGDRSAALSAVLGALAVHIREGGSTPCEPSK